MTNEEVQFFDNIAPQWDGMEVRSTPDRVRWLLSIMPIYEGDRVLDLGTGTGVLVPYLHEIVGAGGSVTAVDFSEGMLAIARKKFAALPGVEFRRSDFEAEPLEGVYDVVMMYCVFPHLHQPFDTIRRLLRDNVADDGCVVIAFPSDESFINHIHGERDVESDTLPAAPVLADRLAAAGFNARCLVATPDAYIVAIYK